MIEESNDGHRLRASQEASLWLERLERILKPDEGPLFRKWLQEPLHREIILSRCKLWHGPEVLAVLLQLIPDIPPPRRRAQWRRITCGVFFVFSSLILVMHFLADSANNAKSRPFLGRVYETPMGEWRKIDFPDGDAMILNAATHVLVSYGPHSREVTLLQGEVTFDVMRYPIRPLLVSAGARQFEVKDQPSRFNLRRVTKDHIELTVIDGEVRALPSMSIPATPALIRGRATSGGHSFKSSEGGDFEAGWIVIRELSAAEREQRLAWQRDLIAANEQVR